MDPAPSTRLFGHIEELRPSCGFVRSDDGFRYFFIPSYVQGSIDFLDLQVGMRCCFVAYAHPRGQRATGLIATASEVRDAEANSQSAAR